MITLKQKIQDIITKSGAKMGIALHHIESGEEVFIDADSYYPLASVFKTPILTEACFRLAEGQIRPDDRWVLKNADKNLPSGVLVFLNEGLTPTVRDLLTLMIIISDNTATDIVLKRLTKDAVNARMRSLGLDHIHITMSVRELFEEIIPNPDPNQPLDDLFAMEREENKKEVDPNNRIFRLTPENNVATPRDMMQLYKLIWEGKIPNRHWSDFALNILLQQQINERIPRFFPSGTKMAHKTGTIGGIRNDTGIIYANENSHVILALFTMFQPEKDAKAMLQRVFEIETAMGEIGLLAYEAYR
jgi:beta-lactamase class A